jgi:3'-5' exoribonuclease
MARQSVGDLRDGDTVDEVYLVADKQLRANRNADLYLLAQLRDKSGIMSGLMWNVTEEQCSHFDTGDFVHIRGKVQLYQGGLQVILTRVNHEDLINLDLSDFELAPRQDVLALHVRMKEILLLIDDAPIRGLMQCFVDDEELMEKMTRTGAGVTAHHAYPGGLIEHITNM